jgi:hypothetical protein
MEHQGLIIQLQMLSNNPSLKTRDELTSLANEYAKICFKVIERTSTAITYLRQGFRGEAVRIMTERPDLIRLASTLEFVEKPAWLRIAESLDVVTPVLPFDLLDELQTAQEQEDKVVDLVRYYRRLNLFRRSPVARSNVLVELKKREPTNPVWEENNKALPR